MQHDIQLVIVDYLQLMTAGTEGRGSREQEVSQISRSLKAIAKELGLDESNHSNSFQSRLLKDPWLKPYTDFELEKFPELGKKKLAVVTPAFVSDCLETLEEIAMEGKEDFMEAGGTDYKHIPCMNDNDDWVAVIVSWINDWKNK